MFKMLEIVGTSFLGLNQRDMGGKGCHLIDPKVIISRAAINFALSNSPPLPNSSLLGELP